MTARDSRQVFYGLPCIGEVVEGLDRLESVADQPTVLSRSDDEASASRPTPEVRRVELEYEIARSIGEVHRSLQASVASGYPPGRRRDEDLMILEGLLGRRALEGLEELDWLDSVLERSSGARSEDPASFRAALFARRAELSSEIVAAVAAARCRLDTRHSAGCDAPAKTRAS